MLYLMTRQKVVIIILAIGLFSVVQYVVFDKLNESKEQDMIRIFQQGYDQGVVDSVNLLYEQTQNCKVAEISIGNLTRNILDLSCLDSENIP